MFTNKGLTWNFSSTHDRHDGCCWRSGLTLTHTHLVTAWLPYTLVSSHVLHSSSTHSHTHTQLDTDIGSQDLVRARAHTAHTYTQLDYSHTYSHTYSAAH